MLSIHYFNNDVHLLYRMATLLEMRLNLDYWCECTWQTNGINETATTQVTDLTVRLRVTSETCIELVLGTRLFHIATVNCSHCDHFWMLHVFVVWNFTRFLFIYLFIYFFFLGGVLSSNVFTTWWHILISRPPRVFRHFKRRSCHDWWNETSTWGIFYRD